MPFCISINFNHDEKKMNLPFLVFYIYYSFQN